MTLSPAIALATARLCSTIRPEWQVPGIVACLQRLELPVDQAIYAAIMAAMDSAAETPGAMTNPLYRMPFTAAEQEFNRELAAQRSREIRDRRTLDEARQMFREWDPEEHRRGYQAAVQAMQMLRADPTTTTTTKET
jgi:hypothetical protein